MKRFLSRRSSWIAVALVSAALGATALAATGALASKPESTPTPAISDTSVAVRPVTQTRADEIAQSFAARVGSDARPTAQASVATTRGAALRVLMPGSGTAAGSPVGLEAKEAPTPVFVETFKGSFRLADVPTPSRQSAPTGTALTVLIEANTGYVAGIELDDEPPTQSALARLGTVRSVTR
jgi:hypothetical protein